MKNLEQENTEKRKSMSLTTSEALSFFFIPIGFGKLKKWSNSDFNKAEMVRFKKFGFDRKIKEAKALRKFGIVFYMSIPIILPYLLN